jgi:hypothetical protein
MGLGRPRDLEPQHRIFRRGGRIDDAVSSVPTVSPGLLAPIAGLLGVTAVMAVAFENESSDVDEGGAVPPLGCRSMDPGAKRKRIQLLQPEPRRGAIAP